MKRFFKEMICMLLVLCLVLSYLPADAGAFAMQLLKPNLRVTESVLIPDVYDPDQRIRMLGTKTERVDSVPLAEGEYLTDPAQAGAMLRETLVKRGNTHTLLFEADASLPFGEVIESIRQAARVHTGQPTEGDYLTRQGLSIGADGSYYPGGATNKYTIVFNITYYTTAEQENQMDTAVEALLDSLDLDGKSDYEKVCAVYDWMCANITYDYTNLEDDTYKLKYTAYAALINRTSVCQGYAVLLYRLMLELGIDCRVIAGTGNGGGHAWNIVKLNGKYYNLDATWDASWHQAGLEYNYFLRSNDTFGDHVRNEEFDSDEFNAAYPMSQTDYGIVDDWRNHVAGGFAGNVNWHYDGNGTLRIFGSGDIPDYADAASQPWSAYAREIENLIIERGIDKIGAYAFAELHNLTRVDLTDSIRYIRENAFFDCSALSEITLPLNLWSIKGTAFGECTALEKIVFQGYPPSVDVTAFQNVTAEARYPASSSNWTEKYLQNYGGTLTWTAADAPHEVFDSGSGSFGAWGIRNDGTLVVSGETGSNTMNDYSRGSAPWYKYCDIATSLELAGYSAISSYAFADFSKIKSINLDGIQKIAKHAFENCYTLESVYIMYSPGCRIEEYAFNACCALEEISFPSNSTIGDFAFSGCIALERIYLNSYGSRIDAQSNSFELVNATVYYPFDGSQSADRTTSEYGGKLTWVESTFGTCGADVRWLYDQESATLTLSGTGAISYYHFGQAAPWGNLSEELRHVIIEDGITHLPSYTFELQLTLETVQLPETLRHMACNAFNTCGNLRDLLIPSSVIAVSQKFNRCDSLTDLYFAGSVQQWEAIAYHENAEGTTDGIVFNMHFLEYHEATATCTESGLAAYYAFAEPSIYTQVYDMEGNWLDQPQQIEPLGHSYDAWYTVTSATCTADGQQRRDCVNCDHYETEVIPFAGHSYTSVVTAPTCTAQGYTTHTCTVCGDSYVDSYVAATGHTYSEWYTVTATSCTTDGQQRRDCVNCDHYETEVIPSAGHSYTSVVTAPTCTAQGYTTHTCTVCGDSYVDSYVEAKGHTEVIDAAVAPTCTTTGLTEGKHCSVCNVVLVAQTEVAATDHSYGQWYVVTQPGEYTDGLEQRDCGSCGHSETRAIPAVGHVHSYEEVVTDPTCTVDGAKVYTCRCGDTYTEVIPAVGHNYTSVVTAPTCTENGYTTHTCANCGDSYTSDPVQAPGHHYSETVSEPTCTQAGKITYTCHCGDTYTEQIPATGHSFVDGTCVHCGASESMLGDVNGDGKVNARDARALLRYVAGLIGEEEINIAAADYNGDGKINARDARALLRSIAGLD